MSNEKPNDRIGQCAVESFEAQILAGASIRKKVEKLDERTFCSCFSDSPRCGSDSGCENNREKCNCDSECNRYCSCVSYCKCDDHCSCDRDCKCDSDDCGYECICVFSPH